MYLIEIKSTVGHRLQLIKYVTTINSVTITKIHMNSSTLLRPVVKIGIGRPIKLFTSKIITNPRDNTQQFITGKQPVIFKILPP